MKNLKLILLTLILFIPPLAQAVIPASSPEAKPQVAGYYQYAFGGKQITALLDGTNFMSPNLFKDIL